MVVFTFLSIINVMALKDDIMAFPYLLYFFDLSLSFKMGDGRAARAGVEGVDKCLGEGSLFQ